MHQQELQLLFATRDYPRFELEDLLDKPHLAENRHFTFFVGVLQGWNSKLIAGRSLSELDYRKNEFIFSWLKSIVVQSSKDFGSSLGKLYDWYASGS
jgi:hypothetical protein